MLKTLFDNVSWVTNPIEIDFPQLWEEYQNVIANPMDLRQVQKNLEEDKYQAEPGQAVLPGFQRDVRLIFTNAIEYNPKGTWYNCEAKKWLKKFDTWVKKERERANSREIKQQLERAAAEKRELNQQLKIKAQEVTRKDLELQVWKDRALNAEALVDEISRTVKQRRTA